MKLALGIDIGTSGVRTAVLTESGEVLPLARADHLAQDADKIDANLWWQAVKTCIERQLKILADEGYHAKDIVGIAVDGTSGSMVLTDADLKPVTRALMYNSKGFDSEAKVIDGFAPSSHITRGANSALARALRLKSEDLEKRAVHLLHQADFISAKLLGRGGHSDHNNALKTGYDPETESWPSWLVDIGFDPSLFPDVHPVGTDLGEIDSQVSAALGLPKTVKIKAGTTDSIAAFLACADLVEGSAVTSLGTTLAVKILSANRIDVPEIGLYSHRIADHWLVGGASNTGGGVLMKYFTVGELGKLTHQIDPSSETNLDYYPLSKPGERFPINDPNFPGNLDPRPKEDAEFLHGMLEGMAKIEALCYAEIQKHGGGKPIVLHTAGGGGKNPVWTKLREKHIGIKAKNAPETEAAIGVAKLAW